MNYLQIRKEYQRKGLYSKFFAEHYSCLFSPFFTKLFVKYNIIPNTVTMFMLVFGVIGSIFFAVPNLACKIIGIIFFHLWYIMDVCDGEVARITKKFSEYGKELDYTAHAVDHPFFCLSFLINVVNKNITYTILIVALGLIDLLFRNLVAFDQIKALKMKNKNPKEDTIANTNQQRNKIRVFIQYIVFNFSNHPLFVMVFPILYLVDQKLNTNYGFLFLIVFLLITSLVVIVSLFKWLRVALEDNHEHI